MAKYAKPRGAKLAIVVVIVTLVVVWLVAFGGAAYIAGLFQPAQTMPAGTFAIGGQNVMVTGGTTTVVEGANRATVYGSNAGLSGVTSVSFRLTVRDTNPGTVAKGFTMTITAGTYQSAGGGNFPLVTSHTATDPFASPLTGYPVPDPTARCLPSGEKARTWM